MQLVSTKVVEITSLPVQYVNEPIARVIVKAVGNLSPTFLAKVLSATERVDVADEHEHAPSIRAEPSELDAESIDPTIYSPTISPSREWLLSETDLEFIAAGCYVLGVGGGGDPWVYSERNEQLDDAHSGLPDIRHSWQLGSFYEQAAP